MCRNDINSIKDFVIILFFWYNKQYLFLLSCTLINFYLFFKEHNILNMGHAGLYHRKVYKTQIGHVKKLKILIFFISILVLQLFSNFGTVQSISSYNVVVFTCNLREACQYQFNINVHFMCYERHQYFSFTHTYECLYKSFSIYT